MIKIVVDLRSNFGPARDQNPRPTCLAFAASDTHAAVRPGWVPLSAEWAYYHAVKRDCGQPQDGSTLASMLAVIKSDGQPAEPEWPYIRAAIDAATWLPPVKPSALFFRDHSACRVELRAVLDQLDTGVPVLLTMTLSDAFFMPDADGVVDRNEAIDPKRRHAVVAVGYAERTGATLVLIRNSWGEGWGLKGYAWLAADYLAPRLTGTAILTTEI
jgi:hypothetical protein